MMSDLERSFRDGLTSEFTCTFPSVIDRIRGSDVNFELVSSSTLRPLRLFYVYNVVSRTYGYVFAWEGLPGKYDYYGKELIWKSSDGLLAKDMAEKVKGELLDPTSLNVNQVEVFFNNTRS
jgi:hypothetical protein